MLISNKSWRQHAKEHQEVDTSHGSGSTTEKGFDPLDVRIENLKTVIARVKARPPSKGNLALLAQYESGLVELEARLKGQK